MGLIEELNIHKNYNVAVNDHSSNPKRAGLAFCINSSLFKGVTDKVNYKQRLAAGLKVKFPKGPPIE